MPSGENSPCRIASFSGYMGDRYDALKTQAETDTGILFGDYLAEMNLAWRALELRKHPHLGYESGFLSHLKLALPAIKANRPKILTNAGALNPKGLAEETAKILSEAGIDLKVAYVEGDNLIHRLDELKAAGETFYHLEDDERHLKGWEHEGGIASANAYVGARGVYEALKAGADVIISGRCTDASPIIAAAAWYHGWEWTNYDALAGALLAGHCIECGAYVTGGNSSGFKKYLSHYYNFSMGIAEINADGSFVVTKEKSKDGKWNGVVNDVTVRSQILYEIQGNVYLNPDVQALIDDITVTDQGNDRVLVTGVRGVAPPPTTKAAICGVAGYQAEALVFATGLDVEEKFEALKLQIRQFMGDNVRNFTTWDMTQYGIAKADADEEALATAMMRIFAQAKTLDAFGPTKSLRGFVNPEGLGHFPGFQSQMDMRTTEPMPYIEYWPGRVQQKHLPLKVTFVGSSKTIDVPPVDITEPLVPQKDYDSKEPLQAGAYGETTRGPLGWIVHARSGDKGGNANVGFFVRNADEYAWLKALLSKAEVQRLMGKEYDGNRIERVELPGMLAVHFVLHDYLGKGVSSTARMDSLAKSVAEFLRARYVDLPNKFLERGKI
ncbi:DUF1446-domain-containing protein [Cutaneotrichosporon oleaginosum]|uniref:DUF1446-domain-containing protein n=1 Tax=Cutaneotrichosporon oleaginosum TaxID=879819 RepID=A0A0J0XUE8_9TREE|nr:DUF1446-domain-containing protein [Cutaneotrichosporon oleaginosum]KLT44726.1 DUF1446-domain-containing protein [Cutaneotrichosporon oleaginosum]TXT07712.1 hypothetical protein COLE_04636 [Cutaneotrichosporon oleaginosum]